MSFIRIAERELHERHLNVVYELGLIAVIAFMVIAVMFAL